MADIRTPPPFYSLPTFLEAKATFRPLEALDGIQGIDADDGHVPAFPPEVTAAVRAIDGWNDSSAKALASMPDLSPTQRFVAIEGIISTALSLLRKVNTAAIHEWTNANETDAQLKGQFEERRTAFHTRYSALVSFLGEVSVAAEIARPSDVGNLRAALANAQKVANLIGTEQEWSVLGVLLGGGIIAFREHAFLGASSAESYDSAALETSWNPARV